MGFGFCRCGSSIHVIAVHLCVLLVFTSGPWAAPHLRYKLLHVIRLLPLCNLPPRICLRTEDAQRSNMKPVVGNILILSFTLLASGKTKTTKSTFFSLCVCVCFMLIDGVWSLIKAAQPPKKCGAPVVYPHTKLASKYSGRQHFNIGEKIYYDCADDFTASSRSIRAVQCLQGGWSRLNLKCESEFSTCLFI